MLGQESLTANSLRSAYRSYKNAKFFSQLSLDREPDLPDIKTFVEIPDKLCERAAGDAITRMESALSPGQAICSPSPPP